MAKTIKQIVHFDVSASEVYDALMDSKKHSAFTGAPASISQKVGGAFNCYGDYIRGKNLELVKNKKIVQEWIGKDFAKGEVSKVIFELHDLGEKKCKLVFTHENVPKKLFEGIDKGWKDFYWDKMKDYFSDWN